MEAKQVKDLMEAYASVYEQPAQEILSEDFQGAVKAGLEKGAEFMKKNPVGKAAAAVLAPVGKGKSTVSAAEQQKKIQSNVRKEEFEEVDEAKKWIQKAIKKPGALSKQLGVPEEENIPTEKLKKAAKAKGKLGQRARLAMTLKGFNEETETKLFDYLLECLISEGYASTKDGAVEFINTLDEETLSNIETELTEINVNFGGGAPGLRGGAGVGPGWLLRKLSTGSGVGSDNLRLANPPGPAGGPGFGPRNVRINPPGPMGGRGVGPENKKLRVNLPGPRGGRGAGFRFEETEEDLFDIILEYLVVEGYADTNEAAIAIMANMSEEWRENILDEENLQEKLKPGTRGKISFTTGRQNFDQKMTEKNPKTGRQRATSPELKAMGAHSRAKSAQYDAENRGDTEAARRHKERRERIAHTVYRKTNRIIDRADND